MGKGDVEKVTTNQKYAVYVGVCLIGIFLGMAWSDNLLIFCSVVVTAVLALRARLQDEREGARQWLEITPDSAKSADDQG